MFRSTHQAVVDVDQQAAAGHAAIAAGASVRSSSVWQAVSRWGGRVGLDLDQAMVPNDGACVMVQVGRGERSVGWCSVGVNDGWCGQGSVRKEAVCVPNWRVPAQPENQTGTGGAAAAVGTGAA